MLRYILAFTLILLLISCDQTPLTTATVAPTPAISPVSPNTNPTKTRLPNFASIKNVQQKKAVFFGYMLPLINQENTRILTLRKTLLNIQTKVASPLSNDDQTLLQTSAVKYKVKTERYQNEPALLTALLQRVDTVPASLALAQSANESAWGTSRFAREGNNFFGQWCFSKGCGIVPKHRDAGASHEVAAFANARASVNAYIRNINTGNAYAGLRARRAQLRAANKPVKGHTLAEGLEKYSERGHEYVKEIQAMIRFNKLGQYD